MKYRYSDQEEIDLSVLHIRKRRRLDGTIGIQGSKNAVLPVMAASLLHRGITVLSHVPAIEDVFCMMEILEWLGCSCRLEEHCLTIDASGASMLPVPDTMAGRMRSSIMLLGPMLGRFGEAKTSRPGGCPIGKRPIGLHLAALKKMGVRVRTEGEHISASVLKLTGARIHLDYPSVGATENIIMAAAAAEGVTVLTGAAREPEIEILCRFLASAGADISGTGSDRLMIRGGRTLHDTAFAIPGDRIVAGTYLGALLCAGGQVLLREAPAEHMAECIRTARAAGAFVEVRPDGLFASIKGRPEAFSLVTGPYPGFPTDLQSVMLAAASVADGESLIQENVFENRFCAAKELQKLGAHIIINGRMARVTGRSSLCGGRVQAEDLRGGAALAAAGLAADGPVRICGYGHIRRGYEDICRDLQDAGAEIWLEEQTEDAGCDREEEADGASGSRGSSAAAGNCGPVHEDYNHYGDGQ
ncbi:MAG: UDP-N-acetylglucosamine 1-carboxyvinyltransferase [Eubacteriales bacterium]|nr:UDP-N-acetylglucosamine 1-carboxyvinyltransferase [Eubacteriales bacterium]